MIKKIRLQNFQSHKDTTIDFTTGVNIIIGKSDSGKSVIIRALYWVIFNKPTGDSFRSNWGGDTRVDLTLLDGQVISRIRTKSENYYLLNSNSRFDALGAGKVPTEISNIINVSFVNFQTQFDPPFLISNTPGEVASHFNSLAGIEQIEVSTKMLKKELNDTKTIIDGAKNAKKSFKTELKQYKYLEQFEINMEVLETENNTLLDLQRKKTKLTSLINQLTEIQENLKGPTKISTLNSELQGIISKNSDLIELQKQNQKLAAYITDFTENNIQLKLSLSLVDLGEKVAYISVEGETLGELRKTALQLKKINNSITENKEMIKKGQKLVKKLEKEWHEVFPDRCPLCGK